MNKKQKQAATRLEKALKACGEAGLTGGVFDGMFCLWPNNPDPHPSDCGFRFFEVVDEIGLIIRTPMIIDGGSGW
jgi:hypothetical protein